MKRIQIEDGTFIQYDEKGNEIEKRDATEADCLAASAFYSDLCDGICFALEEDNYARDIFFEASGDHSRKFSSYYISIEKEREDFNPLIAKIDKICKENGDYTRCSWALHRSAKYKNNWLLEINIADLMKYNASEPYFKMLYDNGTF